MLFRSVACVVNDTFIVQEPDPILITANINNESAPGNGSIQVTVQGGTGNYQFLWNNGSTNQDLLSVAAGTYDLTVTDGNGCSSQAFYQIINEMGAGITLDKESNIGIFPNPNNGVFSINTPTDEAFEVKIFDAQGRLIEEFLVYDNSNLELKLSPAKYHCRIVGTTSHKTYDVPMIVF